jgi:hypothetical protein
VIKSENHGANANVFLKDMKTLNQIHQIVKRFYIVENHRLLYVTLLSALIPMELWHELKICYAGKKDLILSAIVLY